MGPMLSSYDFLKNFAKIKTLLFLIYFLKSDRWLKNLIG
jgi:hypothetical protein